jgi:peptidoglycan LD-endopeptidase LytH
MNSNNFEESLKAHSAEFEPVVPFQKGDKIIAMDFSANNQELTDDIVSDEDGFVHYMYSKLESEKARYAIGGYDEHRTIYRRSKLFDGDGEEARRIHLGVDIWGRPHTKVMAPWRGLVHSLGNNNNFGDYGATVILSHQLDGIVFHTLYGHLSLSSLQDLEVGQTILQGDVFGEFGMPNENGHWPPHLHFQIILDMEGMEGDYPGVCKYSEREKYLANCPDPNLILGLVEYAGA